MQKLSYIVILICSIVLISCEKEQINSADLKCENEFTIFKANNDFDQALVGNWVDTVPAQPFGLRVYQITIAPDGALLYTIKSYGISEQQSNNELSSWTESEGLLKQKQDSLYVKYEKLTWWDSFYEMSPEIKFNYESNFEFWCTYHIDQNNLKTTYLSYPADAPVVTYKNYVRAN